MDIQPLWVGQGDTLYIGHIGGKGSESVVAPFDFAKNAPGKTLVSSPAGNPPDWIVLEDEAHGWRKTEHRVDFALKLDAQRRGC